MRIKGKGKSILTRQRLPVLGLFEGLLDQVSGAAAAYSIRLLRADYSDGLLRVRAFDGTNDQGEADVRPYKIGDEKYVDLNSPIENLESIATGRGLSNSDTLGDLVDSGGSNYDGFVPKWYEQSPNARHATNTTASEQPQLVDTGNLIKENGKPTVQFDGSDDYLDTSATITVDSVFIVSYANISNGGSGAYDTRRGFLIGNRNSGTPWIIYGEVTSSLGNETFVGNDGSDSFGTNDTTLVQAQSLDSLLLTQQDVRINATDVNEIMSGSVPPFSIDLRIGDRKGSPSLPFPGNTQEIIIYPTDKDSEKTNIEKQINNFYSIY